MKIAFELIKEIQNLAKLSFEKEELEKFKEEFEKILKFVEKIQELEIKEAEEVYHLKTFTNQLREDKAISSPEEVREKIIEQFPMREGKLLKVKRIFKR